MEANNHQHQGSDILNELLKSVNTPPQEEEEEEVAKPEAKPKTVTTEVRQLFIGNLPFRVRWQDIKDLFRKAGHVVRADVALNYENRSKGHGTVLFTSVEDAQKAIDMFNNYKWQGRILEVRGDRGFVENKNHNDEPSSSPVQRDKKLVSPSPSKASPSPAVDVKKEILGGKEAEAAETVVVESTDVEKKQVKKESKERKEVKKDKEGQEDVVKEEEEEELEDDSDCRQLFVGNLPFQCQWQDLKDLFRNSGRILRADVVLNFDGRSRGFGTVLFSSHKDAKSAIEQYNGFELHGRILRVHFDKFAASHAKFREEEANTFGQRQIHDPASVELLRQTYLPPPPPQQPLLSTLQVQHHQPQYNYYHSQMNTTANTNMNATATSTATHSTYSPSIAQLQQQHMPFTDMYHGAYNHNAMYAPVNNFGYQHSPSFTHNTTATTSTTTTTTSTSNNTLYNPSMYGYHNQYWLPSQQPQQHHPHSSPYNDLSSSINALHIQSNNTTTTSPDSAGLNSNNNNNNKQDWYQ